MIKENTLRINDEFIENDSIAYRLREKEYSGLEVMGIIIPLRTSTDFPDVTPSHYETAKIFENILVQDRGNTKDFPNVTQGHMVLSSFLSKKDLEKQSNVVDLGCGTGFLGTYLGKNFSLQKLIYSDMSKDSIEHVKKTLEINKKRFQTKNIETRLGDASQTLKDLDGGTAVCAPYLIPGVCTVFPGVYNLFGKIVKNQGMTLYVGHSNLSQKLIDQAAESNGLMKTEVYRKNNLILNPEYGSEDFPYQRIQLKNQKILPEVAEKLSKIGLKEKDGKYFHDIVITRLS